MCGFDEDDCYDSHEHCDGIWHCKKHGGDERGCGKSQELFYIDIY